MNTHPHGPCQCADTHGPRGCFGPAAYAVLRDGKLLRVCPTCLWPDDRIVRILARPHELDVYRAWDDLHARYLERKIVRHMKVN